MMCNIVSTSSCIENVAAVSRLANSSSEKQNLKIIVDTGSWSICGPLDYNFIRRFCLAVSVNATFLFPLKSVSIILQIRRQITRAFAIMWLNIRFLFWLMAAFTELFSWIQNNWNFHCQSYLICIFRFNGCRLVRTTKLITKNSLFDCIQWP